MMLLLDFAVACVNRGGGKKTHGNHSNNNTEWEYLSVSNNNNKINSDRKSQSHISKYTILSHNILMVVKTLRLK